MHALVDQLVLFYYVIQPFWLNIVKYFILGRINGKRPRKLRRVYLHTNQVPIYRML